MKECIQNGYVTFSVPEKKEKNIELTEIGKEFTQNLLAELFEMEDSALDETIKKYSPDFISAIEYFTEMMNQKLSEYHGEQTHEP